MVRSLRARCNKKHIFPFIFTLILVGSILKYWYRKPPSSPVMGWETLESAKRPFKPGIITNVEPPAEFNITLIEPKSHAPIRTKPRVSCRFLVSLKVVNVESSNGNVPPTFVRIKLFNKSMGSPTAVINSTAVVKKSNDAHGRGVPAGIIASFEATPSLVVTLVPSAINNSNREYFYSGMLVAPRKTGDYILTVEVEYVIAGQGDGNDARFKPTRTYQKTYQGAVWHVGI